jgi:hypothetical protein
MAEEISQVSNHVKGTTAAVVSMANAVVMAEEAAAEHVCTNVNRGFYNLMRSQISQKIAKLQSEVDSHLMKLNQLKKNLLAIKNRMERDYGMTSFRYLKLFNGLNANLKQRVFELDRPVINFAIKDVEQISNRTKYLTATVPVSQLESLAMSQKIVISNVKYRGFNVINSMKNFLSDMTEQKKLTDRILLETCKVENTTICIPVIISEINHDKYDSKSFEIAVSDVELSNSTKSAIKNTVFTKIENLEWQAANEIEPNVQIEFHKLLSAHSSPQRVKEMADKLFRANNFQTVKNPAL